MSIEATRWAWSVKGITLAQKTVLLALADRAGSDNTCWPSIPRLAGDCCMDVKTARSALHALSGMGFIRFREEPGKACIYTLDLSCLTPAKTGTPKNGTPAKTGTTKNGPGPLPETDPTPPKNGPGPLPDLVPESKRESIKNLPENRSYSASAPPDAACANSGQVYITRKKRKLAGKRHTSFNRFWAAFAYTRGKAEAADAWLDIPELTDALVERIVTAAVKEAAARPQLEASGRTPKMAQGWIAGRRWEDEPAPPRAIGPPPGAGAASEAQVDLKTFAERCRQRDGIRTSVPSGSL